MMESTESRIEHTPPIEFVPVGPKDVDAYVALETSVGSSKMYSAMTDPAEAFAWIMKSKVYLIKEGDETVGGISYEMKTSDHAYIDGLVIKPQYQGRGLGRAATVKILDELKDVPLIDLVTHPENERAIKLYESLGFVIGERKENYFGDGEPRIVMTLRRQKPTE